METQDDLDQIFAAAVAARPRPSPALMARVMADAALLQPRLAAFVPKANVAPRGWFGALAKVLGGGRSLAGMSAAALTGLYLGIAQPSPVQALTSILSGTTTLDNLDLLPASDTLWAQE